MKYYVTIYIDTMMKLKLDFPPASIPHAFLGLTRKHPDELDILESKKGTQKDSI